MIEKVFNVLTNQVTNIPYTDEQIAELNKGIAKAAAIQAEADVRAAAKESALTKLQALGLSEAEAKQIVGI
jgi:hypothetical protein